MYKKYEYTIVGPPCRTLVHIVEWLDEMGQQGWQVVCKVNDFPRRGGQKIFFYFMREKSE
jgi:hypothetical protein